MALRHVYIVLSLLVLSGFVSSPSVAANSCENPQLRSKLSALEDEWFKRPLDLDKLNTFTARLGELNNTYKEIADPSCRVADKPGQKPNLSSEFRRFHLKVMETTIANQALESCAKQKPILLSKVDKIIRNIAKIDDMGVCSQQKQSAIDELDLYSKLLDNQKKIYTGGAAGTVPIDASNIGGMSANEIKQRLYETSVYRTQDNLSFSSVHAGNAKLIKMNSDQVDQERTQTARDLRLATNQGADAVEAEIRNKFGFDIYGDHFASDENHERRPEALSRANKLHLSVMDGNRINCLRNYLYFTNRFTFAEADKKVAPGTAVKNLFGSDFGHEPGGMAGHQRDAKALTQVGNDTLKEFAKTYKDAPTLNEDTVLKMLEPTLDLMRDQASLDRTANDQLPMYYDGGQKAIQEFQQRKAWAKGMSAQKKSEALAASAKSEVGFLYGTKAMKKLLYVDWKLSPEKQQEEKRRLIREALKERVGEAEKYADWIKEHQNPKGNDLGDFAKDGELLVYSAPNVIASTIHDDPSLLASMCDPLKKAATNLKGSKNAVAQAFEYGGAGVAVVGGPVGMVAGTAFGLVATGIQTFDNARRAAILEQDSKYAGKGENVLDTDARLMAEGDKVVLNKAADEAWKQAWDELKGGLTSATVGIVGGKVVQSIAKEVSVGMKAYREANALKKASEVAAKELDEARTYFKFREQAAALVDGPEKNLLLQKADAWDNVVSQFEGKLGKKLTPEELDQLMVFGHRGHMAGEGKTLILGDGTIDKEKAQALQDLKNHVKDKLEKETTTTKKTAKKDAYDIVDAGANKNAMVFGNEVHDPNIAHLNDASLTDNIMKSVANGKASQADFDFAMNQLKLRNSGAVKMPSTPDEVFTAVNQRTDMIKKIDNQIDLYRNQSLNLKGTIGDDWTRKQLQEKMSKLIDAKTELQNGVNKIGEQFRNDSKGFWELDTPTRSRIYNATGIHPEMPVEMRLKIGVPLKSEIESLTREAEKKTAAIMKDAKANNWSPHTVETKIKSADGLWADIKKKQEELKKLNLTDADFATIKPPAPSTYKPPVFAEKSVQDKLEFSLSKYNTNVTSRGPAEYGTNAYKEITAAKQEYQSEVLKLMKNGAKIEELPAESQKMVQSILADQFKVEIKQATENTFQALRQKNITTTAYTKAEELLQKESKMLYSAEQKKKIVEPLIKARDDAKAAMEAAEQAHIKAMTDEANFKSHPSDWWTLDGK